MKKYVFLVCLIILACSDQKKEENILFDHGAVVRGDSTQKELAMIFTGGDFNDGGNYILNVLNEKNIKASFFFTGNFYREIQNSNLIFSIKKDGHYLGPHSDKHLLYCTWENRDSLLVTKQKFTTDIFNNYTAMKKFGIQKNISSFFIPPFEWYNDSISVWSQELDLTIFNFTPGTGSNADYTIPKMSNYKSSKQIYDSIVRYEKTKPTGLNGFILLLHIGTHPDRTDKFYFLLPSLIDHLKNRGYNLVRIDELLSH